MKLEFSVGFLMMTIILNGANTNLCMVQRATLNSPDATQLQKLETAKRILGVIEPLDLGHFKGKNREVKSNCAIIAEKCAKTLFGIGQLLLMPETNKNVDITYSASENGNIIYHKLKPIEQVEFVALPEFIEVIASLGNKALTNDDLAQVYFTSSRSTIVDDIKSYQSSAESNGADKTLVGLIYYYYKNSDTGYLANFYRDTFGNVYFVDAQTRVITDIPPVSICQASQGGYRAWILWFSEATAPERIDLNYELREELLFYPLEPKAGYFIAQEPLFCAIMEESLWQQDASSLSTAVSNDDNNEKAAALTLNNINDCDCDFCKIKDEFYGQQYQSSSSTAMPNDSTIALTLNRIYNCVCDFKGSVDELRQHIKTNHVVTADGKKKYQCTVENCMALHSSRDGLLAHIHTHTGAKFFACDYPGCNKAFSLFYNLTHHKIIHAGKKPYICDYPGCDKASSRAQDLTKHKRIHTGEKPYICDYPGCDKAYAQVSNTAKHKLSHARKKPYICDYPSCDKAFSSAQDLTKHKLSHAGEKPYICDYPSCDKAFSRSSNLSNHKRTHADSDSYAVKKAKI